MSTVIPIRPKVAATRACADVTTPCPFCGQAHNIKMHNDEGHDDNDEPSLVYYAACAHCGAQGPPADTAALAAASWNHRTAPPSE